MIVMLRRCFARRYFFAPLAAILFASHYFLCEGRWWVFFIWKRGH